MPAALRRKPCQEEYHADQAVGDLRLVGDKGRGDQGEHRSQQQPSGQIVRHRHQRRAVQLALFLPEQKQHHRHRHQRPGLHHPEQTRAAPVGKKVHEIQSHVTAQQDGRGISHQRSRALQVGADGNGQNRLHRGNIQLFGNGKSHRSQHQHRGYIIHKGGYQPREQCQRDDEPFHAGQHRYQPVRQAVWHIGPDEQVHSPHGARQHHQHVPVHRSRNVPQRHDPQEQEQRRRGQGGHRPVLGQ